ncbi:GMC family oxidoreductase [Nocardioides sp. GXZ039]|uniref:GMC family oxidoreductase n=1 Tax=Nocardioides sp. GXZ039 TaxID=3136018 RepID=UPI0030F3706F
MASEQHTVVVVGSGAGGGIAATRLAESGHDVLLIETGGYHLAGSFSRWELGATRQLWNPPRMAQTRADGQRPIAMVSGRSVGGTTNINTKVGARAIEQDYRKWHDATGLVNREGQAFSAADLDPWFDVVERRMRVRHRADWTPGVHVVEKGFQSLGHELHPVPSYTNSDCESCGSCTAGCPTNSGSTTLNRYIHGAVVRGQLKVAAETRVVQILTEADGDRGRRAIGVVAVGPDGVERTIESSIVVLAAGSLVTPQLLQLSGLADLGTPASKLVGRTLGTHTARMVHGVFDEIMDTHVVYPITAHCQDFADDAAGGFIVEATTVMDPIALASALVADDFTPLIGTPLTETMSAYRHLAGLFMMTNDSNLGQVTATEDHVGRFEVPIPPEDQRRLDEAHAFCTEVLYAAGAKRVVSTGYITSHVQGSVTMGSDPDRSCCDSDQQLWDVSGLYIGDGSVIPRTLTYNPSLTIMALAERLADHLNGVLGGQPRLPDLAVVG